MHVNKVSYVFTIDYVAEMLGKTQEDLEEIAETMDPEDGCLRVIGVREHGLLAFTKFGIQNLREQLGITEE